MTGCHWIRQNPRFRPARAGTALQARHAIPQRSNRRCRYRTHERAGTADPRSLQSLLDLPYPHCRPVITLDLVFATPTRAYGGSALPATHAGHFRYADIIRNIRIPVSSDHYRYSWPFGIFPPITTRSVYCQGQRTGLPDSRRGGSTTLSA